MEPPPGPSESGIYCSACGHLNSSSRLECEQCGTRLLSPDKPGDTPAPQRPGCVTAYAVLLGIGAGLFVLAALGGVCGLTSDSGLGLGVGELLILAIGLGVACLYILLARGLWRLKNWARVTVIVLQSLGVAVALLQVCGAIGGVSGGVYGSETGVGPILLGAVVGLAISGYIIYWFATHRQYFS